MGQDTAPKLCTYLNFVYLLHINDFSLVLRGSRGLILEALIPIFLYYQNRYKLGIIKSALSLLLIFLFHLFFTLRAGLGIESGILYSLLRSFAMTFSNYELYCSNI